MGNLFYMLLYLSLLSPHTRKITLGKVTNVKTLIHLLPTVLLLILLLLEQTLAGGPPIQWQKTFGGSEWDEGHSVQQTSDGGYIITGFSGAYIYNPIQGGDVCLLKTDPNGNSDWQQTFGGGDDEYGCSVQQTSDGGYIIAGWTSSFGSGNCDFYLIKTEPNGNEKWQKTFGGSEHDRGYSVKQTTDCGYIITGYTQSYGAGSTDVYLIKTDPNGDSQWQKTFGGSGIDWGWSVQQTFDGGYIIAGETDSYGAGELDVYLIKTDPNGDKKWQKTFGGSDHDWGKSVQQTTDGGYIITGYTWSFGAGLYDVYLIKTDPNGNSQWQKTFGGSDHEIGYSVLQTSDGGFIIAGGKGGVYGPPGDVYLVKTDPNGNSRWQKTLGGSSNEHGRSIQQTFDGGYIITGFTHSYGAGSSDVYLIKLCPEGTLSADFNCNGTVYYEDLEVLVDQWLQPPVMLSADIFPEPGDGIVNGLDFAALANFWLQTAIP
jgi:hypothetical protein